MPEFLEKLRPDQDLYCYFERPSAIAAMHDASATGYKVSGAWRQQFDWVVIEWNRDNVIEHPLFRYLPDGDLRGLELSYEETRSNCIPLDSELYPTVSWPFLRIWADDGGVEKFYRVPLRDYAIPVVGEYVAAFAELELSGTPTTGDYIGLSFLGENHTYQLYAVDTLETAIQALVDSVNTFSTQMVASRTGAVIRLTYVGEGQSLANSTVGHNGNRIGVYGFVSGAKTETWTPWWRQFSGGSSPTRWRVTLPFDSLLAEDDTPVPVDDVRKMRWTYAADMQPGAFERSEFEVEVSNWSVAGVNRLYSVAGPGSRRIEDKSPLIQYSGAWSEHKGNFSGGTIRYTEMPSSSLRCSYRATGTHRLYLGTRGTFNGAEISVTVDSQPPQSFSLLIPGEDVLRRVYLGDYGSGDHAVTVEHTGAAGTHFYFDFLEQAVPTHELPAPVGHNRLSLSTDWDTDHSLSVPAERTAKMIESLGFHGRVNHYVGALWYYELHRPGHQYASATVDFTGTPEFSKITEIRIGRTDQPPEQDVIISHVNRIGDTAETIAKAFELELNRGYTAVRAVSSGGQLTVYSRTMGADGNNVTISATPAAGDFHAITSGATLTGGLDGAWRTDLAASPRLNRAVRDWSDAFYRALAANGRDVVAAFSMELQHGDPSVGAGIAQRYPNGNAVWLNTPALQTNFSFQTTAYYKEVYREMADIMAAAGQQPFLQFGEVQWWYFPSDGSGMPYYDDYTTSAFLAQYGRAMSVIPNNDVDPASYPEETEFLAKLIGDFTDAIITHVKATHPNCRFEVLYPTDVNETAFNSLVNFPVNAWTPAKVDSLKTESFTYTYSRNLNDCKRTITYGTTRGFAPANRSFLVGIADPVATWMKEVRHALAENVESITLFALDQFSLIGYPAPLPKSSRRSVFLG